jgi:hypothetical protein
MSSPSTSGSDTVECWLGPVELSSLEVTGWGGLVLTRVDKARLMWARVGASSTVALSDSDERPERG